MCDLSFRRDLQENLSSSDENITLKRESPSSLATFIPRLASGARITLNATVNTNISSLNVFNRKDIYAFPIDKIPINPSITATYDQGSDTFIQYGFSGIRFSPYSTSVLVMPLLFVLAFLSLAVVVRYRRKSRAKIAFGILEFILHVLNDLKKNPGKIISYHLWETSIDTNRQVFDDYNDYKKIDAFYMALRDRELAFSSGRNTSLDDPKDYNDNCIKLAKNAFIEITWRKFYELDYLLLIPSMVLGSLFVTFVCEALPYLLLMNSDNPYWNTFILVSFILRGSASFLIIKGTLKVTNNISIENNKLTFLSSFLIMGLSIWMIIDSLNTWSGGQLAVYLYSPLSVSMVDYVSDILRMILLTVVISKVYVKRISNLKTRLKAVA